MNAHPIPVVLSATGAAGNNEDVVGDNVAVVNDMYRAFLGAEEMAPNALRSYFVDFYVTQALDGGFAQYVFMTPDRAELDLYIREGLEGMGARAHLELFNRTSALYELLTELELQDYLEDSADPDGNRSDGAAAMDLLDAEFEDLFEGEDVTGLNAAWLRNQPGLLVLDERELAEHIAARAAQVADLAQRQAEAEREDTPEFEFIIRELCDVAGHEFVKVTLGDPNFQYDGGTSLAWHFTTDQGEFIMLDGDEEALMLEPGTLEIVAGLEFETEGGETAEVTDEAVGEESAVVR